MSKKTFQVFEIATISQTFDAAISRIKFFKKDLLTKKSLTGNVFDSGKARERKVAITITGVVKGREVAVDYVLLVTTHDLGKRQSIEEDITNRALSCDRI